MEEASISLRVPDWTLKQGVASLGNLALLLIALLLFPFVLHYSGALSVAAIPPESPRHTPAFVRFCFTVTIFLWLCFAIVFLGIKRRGAVRWQQLVGAGWSSGSRVLTDLCIAVLTLLGMFVIGNVSNALLGPLQHDSAAFRSMVAQNATEALAFLAAALTAGFVEEFVFRGYLQRQFTAIFGSVVAASVLQIAVFTVGHFYQGWIRLIPVLLIGSVLTIVALWRKSLVPGMIAHGVGDGLVALSYFAKHL